MATLFVTLAFISLGVAIVFSIRIVNEIRRRAIKVNFALLRLYLFKYIHQYRELTVRETGRPGPLYYPCTVSYFMALVLTVAYLIAR